MKKIDLGGIWNMKGNGFDCDGTVPGSVYSFLLNNGLMEDPYYRQNELDALALMEHDYTFSRSFVFDKSVTAPVLLCCDGLDTICDIFLNGQMVGHTENMHRSYEFDIMHAVTDFSDGIWYVYFGCFDDAGNFRMNMNFIGMGARYPEITYPKSSSEFYTNKMLVKGVAPNPDVHGNSNKGTFQISWKKLEDSTWSENGIDYLVFDKSLSATERDLAVWNIAKLNLEKGEYAIRLSVRECDTCKWISSETIVPVDDLILPDSANAPKLVITPPVGNQVAGHTKDATIELKNVPSSSKWIVKASIEAPSPKDSSVYIRALEKTFDPMTISPFFTT